MVVRRASAAAVALGIVLASGAVASGEQEVAVECDESSWVGGTTEWCRGVLVHRDHIYDDYGAELYGFSAYDLSHNGTVGTPGAGDVSHADHGQALNSTDLRVLRIGLDGRELNVRFELNTLFPDDQTIAAVAVDIDGDPSAGGGAWPHIDVSSDGWEEMFVFSDRDPNGNTIEGTAELSRDPAERIRLYAVVALGDGTPMNAAFRTGESGAWWENEQAEALAAGDISRFALPVEVRDFKRRTHRPAAPAGPGYYDRVYRSDYPLGEGVSLEGVPGETKFQLFHFLGEYQPYAIYVPDRTAPHGVQLRLHGATGAHGGNNELSPGVRARFGDDLNRILISPLGRGPSGGWIDWAARDALDALADVKSLYSTDTEAVFVSGYSMGGTGTFFLSTLFPDRFAGAINWVGSTGDSDNGTPFAQGRQRPSELSALGPYDPTGYTENTPEGRSFFPGNSRGNAFDYFENTRHVRMAHLYNTFDELVWAPTPLALGNRLAELGYEQILYVHFGDHSTLAFYDDWRKEAAWSAGRRLVRHPARVTYRTNSFLWMPMVDLIPDGAYWVDGMLPHNDATTPDGDMIVDLTSHACDFSSENVTEIRHGSGTDPWPWVSQEGTPVGPTEIDAGSRISGVISNVRELTIDVEGACFRPREKIALDITVDSPTLIHFTDGRRSQLLSPPTGTGTTDATPGDLI